MRADMADETPFTAAPVSKPVKRCDFTKYLPVEILAEIFNLVRDDNTDADWQTIAWVDSRWREIALADVNLWKRLSLTHRHTPADIMALLGRSGSAMGLDLTLHVTSRFSIEDAECMLWSTLEPGTCERIRKLAIYIEDADNVPFDMFLRNFRGPNLESLTFEYCDEEQADDGTKTERGSENEPQLVDRPPEPIEENPEIFGMLPELPKLRELRIRGMLLLAPPKTLAQLTTLEASSSSAFLWIEAIRPGMVDDYMRRLLMPCQNLEQLFLTDFLAGFLYDPERIALPALQYLEAFHGPPAAAVLYSHLEIPDTAAVHLRTYLHADSPPSSTDYMLPFAEVVDRDVWRPPFLQHTMTLAFHATANQSVQGWLTPWPAGAPAWSYAGAMDELDARTRRALLPHALRDLPRTVEAPRRIVHLEVHIHYTMGTALRAADWRGLLREFSALRVLHVGGVGAAHSLLAALAVPRRRRSDEEGDSEDKAGEEEAAPRRRDRLPRRLHELGLCLDWLDEVTCRYIVRQLPRHVLPVLRIRLPEEARWERGRRRARAHALTLGFAAVMEERWGTTVWVDHGERCETCQCAEDPAWVEEDAVDWDGEDEPEFDQEVDVCVPEGAEEDDGWMPQDPDDWNASSGDWQYFEVDETDGALSDALTAEAEHGQCEYCARAFYKGEDGGESTASYETNGAKTA